MHICVPHVIMSARFPGTEVMDCCEPSCGCWESNPYLLKEQQCNSNISTVKDCHLELYDKTKSFCEGVQLVFWKVQNVLISTQGLRYILDPIILAKIHIAEHIKIILERKSWA